MLPQRYNYGTPGELVELIYCKFGAIIINKDFDAFIVNDLYPDEHERLYESGWYEVEGRKDVWTNKHLDRRK